MTQKKWLILIALILLILVTILYYLTDSDSSFYKNSFSDNPTVPNLEGSVLVDPEMAPNDIHSQVMYGYRIILETKKHLPTYAGDRINCTNCHFAGGNTQGGENGGISLVGVTHKYLPTNSNAKESLAKRINSCFENSLNGRSLPEDSEPMQAMITYLQWISSEITDLSQALWLGLKPLKSLRIHEPNPQNGARLYEVHCIMCHGNDGQGQDRPDDLSYPPLWGKGSFNDAAGMNRVELISSFVYDNMPYQAPDLTEEEAIDVSAFITSQPRPIKRSELR